MKSNHCLKDKNKSISLFLPKLFLLRKKPGQDRTTQNEKKKVNWKN